MKETQRNILVVEDDARQRTLLAEFLEKRGYGVRAAPDAETALGLLTTELSQLVLMDVRMPGMGGVEGLVRMGERFPSVPVILLTAFAGVNDAVRAMRHGAVDYLEKPVDLDELLTVIGETIGGPSGCECVDLPPLPEGFIVASDGMRRLVHEISLVARTSATVLVTGESGTGKERIAELVHQASDRSDGTFVRVNCAVIPENLVESELFGHIRGAFTGAEKNRVGRFETAAGGTILLDEIGELPLSMQPKLLRVLEDGSFERVGESTTRHTDARVVACTNRDLEKEVAAGTFREDLFWRLNVYRVHVPPLRERKEEIAALARAFLARATSVRCRLSAAALRVLEAYEWPGNVRELANVIERAAILAAGGVILPDHLPDSMSAGRRARERETAPHETSRSEATGSAEAGASRPEPEGATLTVEEAERRAIRDALEKTGGNRTRAAKLLGISRRTLLYRLKRYGGEP